MFNFFKKSEYEEISQKIKYKNHKITEKLNKAELNKFSKLSSKKQKEYLREVIEGMGGLNFSQVLGYSFDFKELPMFNYILSINGNNYNLGISGKDEYFGFRCDYLLSENVYLLTLISKEENDKENKEIENMLGTSKQVLNVYRENSTKLETTKKAKKLHKEMISTDYLNEFSYNEMKKNPIRVV
jgi:hypothetical protein